MFKKKTIDIFTALSLSHSQIQRHRNEKRLQLLSIGKKNAMKQLAWYTSTLCDCIGNPLNERKMDLCISREKKRKQKQMKKRKVNERFYSFDWRKKKKTRTKVVTFSWRYFSHFKWLFGSYSDPVFFLCIFRH